MNSEERSRLFARNRGAPVAGPPVGGLGATAAVAAREVTMTELHRRPAGVLSAVRDGEVAVVSKHKRAVAMIVPLDDELDLVLCDPVSANGLGELAAAFSERAAARWSSATLHGRWYGKRYRRYRRGSGRPEPKGGLPTVPPRVYRR